MIWKLIRVGKLKAYVYDFSTESGKFCIDGVVLHNTDSLFIQGPKEKVLEFLKKINEELPGRIQLDLEDYYVRGLFVKRRGASKGAKKKYALLSEDGRIKLRGFEAVRSDWAPIVKETQKKVLEILLKEGDIEKAKKFVQEIIKKLRNREIPWRELVIYETIRKPLSEYKVEAPHVAAAKRYLKYGYKVGPGFKVGYIIVSETGKVSDRIKIVPELEKLEKERGNANIYNPDYYIEKQLMPAVEQIFDSIGINWQELEGKTKKNLWEFFKKK